MTFVYEKLTEQDWEKYESLGIGDLTSWYIDKERDVSIWVGWTRGGWQAFAEGLAKPLAQLRVKNYLFKFVLVKGNGSTQYSQIPYHIVWDGIESCTPEDFYGLDHSEVILLLKEALSAWGGGHEDNTKWHPNFIVHFNF